MSKKTNPIDRELIENYRGRLERELLVRGVPGFLDWLTDEYQKHIELIRIAENRIDELEQFAPLNIAMPVTTAEQSQQAQKLLESKGDVFISTPSQNARWVNITLAIREPDERAGEPLNFTTVQFHGLFPGTTEEALAEIGNRLEPLIYRSPMLDNVRGARIDGVTDEQLSFAMTKIGQWWSLEDFKSNEHTDFWQRLKDIYQHFIKPHMSYSIDDTTGYRLWREIVEQSFEKMIEYERHVPARPRKRSRRTQPKSKKISLTAK